MNSSLWLSILCYAVQICRLYRFGIFRCNSLYYNGIKAELVNIHFGFGIYNNKDSRLHISCSSGRKVGGCIGWTSEAFAWFFAAHSIAWTDHIPFDLCGKLVSAAEWKNEGVWFRFGSYNCWRQNNFQFWEASYLSSLLLGLTTPHSIHTPPQAVSVGVSVAWRWCRPALELLAIAPLSAGRTLVKCGCGDGSVSHSQASILEVIDSVFIKM